MKIDKATGALERIRAALEERERAVEAARSTFWIRVGTEIATGQISQADAARALNLTREVLRQRTRQYLPNAPLRPRRGLPLYLAIGMRLAGERRWRVQVEACEGHPILAMTLATNGPFGGRTVEFAYRETDQAPKTASVRPPTWPEDLQSRPLFLTDGVFDEIWGPPIVGSEEWQAWKRRVARLPPVSSHAG